MKKNIFKKAGRVFTSLALAVSICLTMSVSVFAKNGNDLENKNINYRDYLYFVIDGKDYKMTDLTTEPGVDLSGSNVSAEVYAKVDMECGDEGVRFQRYICPAQEYIYVTL